MDELRPGSDTHPAAARIMLDWYRRATPTQKLGKVFSIGAMINDLVRAELRRCYPASSAREIELRLAARNLDRDTMIRVFGWDPDVQGR